jgi:hypothetical protein
VPAVAALVACGTAVAVAPSAPAAPAATAPPVVVPLATWLKAQGTTQYPSPGAIAVDTTNDGHDGLISGATWVPGDASDSVDPGGQALSFASGAYVDVATAVDLTLSRTVSLEADVNFAANPGAGTQVLLQKDPGDGTQSPYGVEVTPATSTSCKSSTCASIGLLWGGQWILSKPLLWTTGKWYTLKVKDDGRNITFLRGPSPTALASMGQVADPTSGAGTQGSSGSLYLGRGPGGANPFVGEMQDVELAVPLTVAPFVSGLALGYTSAPVGTPLTATAKITGAWGNPEDPYLPQPDIYDQIHAITPVATDMADPGSITATMVVIPPSGTAVNVPGFLNQNFVNGPSGIVPTGAPVWTFRYTPRGAGTFSAHISVTTFNGTTATTATTPPHSFTVGSQLAPSYTGFVQANQASGASARYYEYSQTGNTFFAAGSNFEINEFSDASHTSAEGGMFGGYAGKEEVIDGVPTAGVGELPGNGETGADLAGVYQQYFSDLANLHAVGANSGRLRLETTYIPLEFCPAANWSTACARDLEETYTDKNPVKQHGLVGYPNGVLPQTSSIFTGSSQTPSYFGTFTIGRYNDANAWIVDQVVEQARQDGIALQLSAWNEDLDYGSSCYAQADVEQFCFNYYNHRVSQNLVERRLYYDQARWGYSPSVFAWEYVNEYAAVNLTTVWTGATVTVGGSPQYVPGITAWLRTYNDPTSPNSNPHLITTSCTASIKGSPICNTPDEVEYHFYSFLPVQGSYNQDNWKCIAGKPCIRSEYGISGNSLPDPYSWVVHKGPWAALAANFSGAWFWWTEQDLNNPANTPPNPDFQGTLENYVASWDPWTSTQNPNPYTSFTGIVNFTQAWPGNGADSPQGLDSYAWQQATITGGRVVGPSSTTHGIVASGMVGKSTVDGALNALVWLVNNQSTGADPTSSTAGYTVVPASNMTVTGCTSCTTFVAGATYTVRMWDTVTGTLLPQFTTTVTASTSGAVKIAIPAVTTDLAVTISPR